MDPEQLISEMRKARRTVVNLEGAPVDIPSGPDDPRWAQRIPPPDPLPGGNGTVAISAPPAVVQASNPTVGSAKRVVVSYGPRENILMVSVEVAPDWDTEGDALEMSLDEVVAVVKVVRLLGVKMKNITGKAI